MNATHYMNKSMFV